MDVPVLSQQLRHIRVVMRTPANAQREGFPTGYVQPSEIDILCHPVYRSPVPHLPASGYFRNAYPLFRSTCERYTIRKLFPPQSNELLFRGTADLSTSTQLRFHHDRQPDQAAVSLIGISTTDVVIIGAGPYGLSIGAHLKKRGIRFRIFGEPMHSWAKRMPDGMFLKSEGFASNLYDPDGAFTLRQYCAENRLPYRDIGLPVPIETFVAYGREFQKRLVPGLEECEIVSLRQVASQFELETSRGERLRARNVVLAIGITHFAYTPAVLQRLPRTFASHSSDHKDPTAFRGATVAVVGSGASAVELSALLHAGGAKVHLIARSDAIHFHEPPREPRPWLERIRNPRSGLGTGWRSRLCTDAPLLFYALPHRLRSRAVHRHLGPAPGWFVKDRFVGRVTTHMGLTIQKASIVDGRVHLLCGDKAGEEQTIVADHVIAGCGYHVSLSRVPFLDPGLRDQVKLMDGTPALSTHFESSVPGLFMVGLSSANNFGPMTRFAYGAGFTARRLTRRLARRSSSASHR